MSATRELINRADALLLDFNGTLSDDEDLLAEIVSEIAEHELGITISKERYFTDFAGFTEEHMFSILAAESAGALSNPSSLLHLFNAHYLARTKEQSRIAPDARAFVHAACAAGKQLAVVTAASRDTVLPALHQAGLAGAFTAVIAFEDVSASKPEPECYIRAVAQLGLPTGKAVAFEDSRTGIAAATRAGLATVAVLGSLTESEAVALTKHSIARLTPDLISREPRAF
ncbi:HAD family phosphatase [Leucobacter insecticola]|uniref:HAD family phosphatase n=1 Tax=Leucobacter insecticola TaxID=2714934 RepID=A0A6G8FL60_9MICO|nr:HAD family phosphatase [Leucobacter insecticola]QIM17107.1 HAD family phosphatase [Leucobacter insecticola]